MFCMHKKGWNGNKIVLVIIWDRRIWAKEIASNKQFFKKFR